MTLYALTVTASDTSGFCSYLKQCECEIKNNRIHYNHDRLLYTMPVDELDRMLQGLLSSSKPSISVYTTDVDKLTKYEKYMKKRIKEHLLITIQRSTNILRACVEKED